MTPLAVWLLVSVFSAASPHPASRTQQPVEAAQPAVRLHHIHYLVGDPSAAIDVNVANSPPNQPTALTLSKDAQGNTVLNWTAPAVGDPDAGDAIDSYRIYRDGIEITNRTLLRPSVLIVSNSSAPR